MKKDTKKKVKRDVRKTKNRDWNKILQITLTVLLIIEIILIPCLVYAEVKRVLPIVMFLIVPTVFGLMILLLSKSCSKDYQRKLEKMSSN